MIEVRPEEPRDAVRVFEINRRAFETEVEAKLVDVLRSQVDRLISLVAELDGEVVGHILFTPVTVEGGNASLKTMGLGPMAVLPEFQRRGIGSKLVRVGLAACRTLGEQAVFVVGHPEFYARFGFELAAPKDLHFGDSACDPYFFVAELEPGALTGLSGSVAYHPAFSDA